MAVKVKKTNVSPLPSADPGVVEALLKKQAANPDTLTAGELAILKANKVIQETAMMKGITTLDQILTLVKKSKGDAIAIKGGSVPDVHRIPTGVFEVDLAIGGGFPMGRISIVYGVESSGKTNLALKAIAYVQKYFPLGKNRCVFVNLEGTFDPLWATQLGVDVDMLDVVNPAYGEEAVDVVDALLRASDLALMVVDSIAVMVSSREVDASTEKADVGTAPMLVKRMCNKAVIALAMEARLGHYPALILINQRRFKVGVMFGDPETMPGGETMKFLSSLTLRLYGKNVSDKNFHPDLPVWKDTDVVIKKSKVPVNAANFNYKMAMQQAGDVDIGESDSWGTVCGYLKSIGVLVKETNGWSLFGITESKQSMFEAKYLTDLGFRVKCQQTVVMSMADKKFIVPASEDKAPKADL